MQIWRNKKKSLIIFLACVAVVMGSFLFRLMELSSVIHLNPGEGKIYTPPMQIPCLRSGLTIMANPLPINSSRDIGVLSPSASPTVLMSVR